MHEFKAGQEVRVKIEELRDYRVKVPEGTVGTFDHYSHGDRWGLVRFPGYVGDGPDGLVKTWDKELEAVPAGPKWSDVKVGDKVTLTKGETSVRGPVTGISYAGGGEWDFRVGEEPYRRAGRIGLWEVTDHQPAPEPEYEPRKVYEHPNGDRFWSINTEHGVRMVNEYGDHFPPDDLTSPVRPLVVIDPAAVDVGALAKAYDDAYYEHETTRAGILAALAYLGIEAP